MLCPLAKSSFSLGSREKGRWQTTLVPQPGWWPNIFPASVYAPASGRSAVVSETSISPARCAFSLESRDKGSWYITPIPQPGESPNTFPCRPARSNTWPFSNGARDSHQCSQEHLLLWNPGRRAVGIQPLSGNSAGSRTPFPASVPAPTLGRSATVLETSISGDRRPIGRLRVSRGWKHPRSSIIPKCDGSPLGSRRPHQRPIGFGPYKRVKPSSG